MSVGDVKPHQEPRDSSTSKAELLAILQLGWPNCVRLFLEFVPGIAMLSFLGSNTEHLAAAGMGFMFSNVSGISLIIGVGSGSSPLTSQAFGAGNFLRCGDLLQRQLAIFAVVLVFVSVMWLNTERILVTFGQPLNMTRLTGQFMLWRVAALPFLALKEAMANFLVAQGVMWFPMLASIAASMLNVALFPPLIGRMGFVGAPVAITLSNVLQAVLLCSFASCTLPHREAWPRWSLRTAFSGWSELLRLALPSGLLMLCEWWGWEINLFFAGLLCDRSGKEDCIELDVFPIVANTMVICFMVHIGFSIAAGTQVGNALGAGDPQKARRVSRVVLVLVASISGTICCTLILLRKQWGRFFSDDDRVVERTAQVLPVVALYIFCDAIGPGALVNLLRSVGLVRFPALMNFVAFYVIGIPFGLYLTFGRTHEQWGILGLWSGLTVAMLVMVSSLLGYLFCGVHWQEAAQAAQAQAWAGPTLGEPQDGKIASQALGKQSYKGVAREEEVACVVGHMPSKGSLEVASP